MPESTIGIPATAAILLIIFVIAALIGTGIGQEIFKMIENVIGGGDDLGSIRDDHVAFNSVNVLACAIQTVAKGVDECSDEYNNPGLSGSVIGMQSGLSDIFGNEDSENGENSFEYNDKLLKPEERAWVDCDCGCGEFEYSPDKIFNNDKVTFIFQDNIWKWKSDDLGISDFKSTCGGGSGVNLKLFDKLDPVFSDYIFLGSKRPGSNKNGFNSPKICNDFNEGLKVFQDALIGVNDDDELTFTDYIGEEYLFNNKNYWAIDHKAAADCKCTVNNFHLPQYVSDAEDWITKYGDPDYLIYWNTFPMEEANWIYEVDWGVQAAIFAISIIPWGKVASTGVKAGLLTTGQVMKFGTKKATRAWLRNAIKTTLKNKLVKRFSTKKFAKYLVGVGAKATILESGATVAQLVESITDKYEPVDNSLVLKKPLNDPITFDLDESWSNKPVLVKWKPDWPFESISTFHLVSPCHLESFDVVKQEVSCNGDLNNNYIGFSTDTDSGSVYCSNPKDRKNKITCGDTSTESLNNFFETDEWNIYSNVIKSDNRLLFEYGEDGILKKIGLPYYSAKTGKDIYIDEISFVKVERTDIESKIIRDYYTPAEHYEIETYNGKVHVGNEALRDIIIECKKNLFNDKKYSLGTSYLNFVTLDLNFECVIKDSEFPINFMNPEKTSTISVNTLQTCSDTSKTCQRNIEVTESITSSGTMNDKRELSIDRGRFFTQFIKIGIISFFIIDDDGNGEWDTISSKGFDSSGEWIMVGLSDIDENGEPHNIQMNHCDTNAIVVDFGYIPNNQIEVDGDNYCLRHKSATETAIKWGGRAVGTGVAILGLVSGVGTAPTIAILAGAATIEAGTEIGVEWSSEWPG